MGRVSMARQSFRFNICNGFSENLHTELADFFNRINKEFMGTHLTQSNMNKDVFNSTRKLFTD